MRRESAHSQALLRPFNYGEGRRKQMFRFNDSIDLFHQRAREARQLDDFGEDDYMEALAVLCRSLDDDASLSAIGEFAVQGMITEALEARLLVEQGWKDAPNAIEARVERPLVILGLPRSGTTALHHLMAQDPDVQALEHWILRSPKPRPPREQWAQDPDYQAAVERVEMIYKRAPEMRAIHEIEAHLPDECWHLFSQNFAHSSYEANADVKTYARWWAETDMTPVYRRHRRNVQLIGHREPEKRWLFKDSTHLFDADALFNVYPDALVVQTHRDPTKLIPSVCSLCWSARGALNPNTNPKEFGRSTLDLWDRSISNMMSARKKRDPGQFYDLPFERFVQDPVSAIQDIYAAFDLDFSPQAERAIRQFREANPKGKHGDHSYAADEWGLDLDEIRERFRPYTDAYDVETGAL
jgi:hypothetical protein